MVPFAHGDEIKAWTNELNITEGMMTMRDSSFVYVFFNNEEQAAQFRLTFTNIIVPE
jgi:hypothetical protein